MRIFAMLVGVTIMALSAFGLVQPQGFATLAGAMQVAPAIYVAALVRIVVGPVLILAARSSRAPMSMRIMGAIITLGGIATLFVGVPFGQAIVRFWADGGIFAVRIGAACAFAVGAFIFYATAPAPGMSKDRHGP